MANNKNVRSSQLLSPFGVGQIINFPKEVSYMVCGLNLWDEKIAQRKAQAGYNNIEEAALRINEPRLQKLLNVEYFVKPFIFSSSGIKNKHLTIPAVRFPRWHHCTNHKCGRMREIELTMADEKIECDACAQSQNGYKSKMIPVRFVAACSRGHIQDIPFREWVHNGQIRNTSEVHNISYHSLSGSGDLGSILIKCSCGESRTLAGLMNIRKNGENILDSALARIGLNKDDSTSFSEDNPNNDNPEGEYCKGHRPWLGLDGVNNPVQCNDHLQVLIRGASNVHFSEIISALYLPKVSEEANPEVSKAIEEKGIDFFKKFYDLDLLPAILEGESVVRNGLISKEDLLEGVIKELQQSDENEESTEYTSEDTLRQEEYKYILAGRESENSDFKAIKKSFEDYLESEFLNQYFENVVLIEKLKETRVFRSFARINPNNRIGMGELSSETIKWLPANEVYGEGIFIKFQDEVLDNWNAKNGHLFSSVIQRYQAAMLNRRPSESPRNIDPRFLIIHTLSHLLIKKLCYHCGYGSSSLREKIYFDSDPENRMNGLLIYTSSGDSEGSLGGLVRQGKSNFLGKLIKESIEDAKWCSADPVCSDIGQSSGQGPDNINGAACHNCCIVPETSCEEFNMLLDRTTIIGSYENPEIGFFTQI